MAADTDEENASRESNDLTPLRRKQSFITDKRVVSTFGILDGFLVLTSLVTYLVDTMTDVLVSAQYFQQGHYTWGGLTIGFIIVPSIIVQCFSLRWYQADGKPNGCRTWLVHLFQLQPLERYIQVLNAGMEARRGGKEEQIQTYFYQQNDVCMLRLFEAFLESAPQLTLQMYVMVATDDAGWLTGVSAGVSLLAVGWAVAIYSHALRQAHRKDYRLMWPSLLLQTLWHICTVAARVCALVAFASLYKAWIFLVIGLHWTLMSIWVTLQHTDFCPTRVEERLFNGVVGAIYIYCFFSLKEGQTRWRMLVFYTVLFIENAVLVGVWYPFRPEDGWTTDAIITVVFGVFFLVVVAAIFGTLSAGIACMLVYYRFCHPSGPIYCIPKNQEQSPESNSSLPRVSSGLYQLQVDLVPRTSTVLLPRKAQLKPQTSLAMAAPPVVYKEVHTPSQLTPIKPSPTCRRVIDYDRTFEMEDNSLFQHFSIETSQCMAAPSRCVTLNVDGVDLTCDMLSTTGANNQDCQSPSNDTPVEVARGNDRHRNGQEGSLASNSLINGNWSSVDAGLGDLSSNSNTSSGSHDASSTNVQDNGSRGLIAFEHPSFEFIDDADISHRDSGCGSDSHSSVTQPVSDVQSTFPISFDDSDDEETTEQKKYSVSFSKEKLTNKTGESPSLYLTQTPAVLKMISPIHDVNAQKLANNAGCFKFPRQLPVTPGASIARPAGNRAATFASTPHANAMRKCLEFVPPLCKLPLESGCSDPAPASSVAPTTDSVKVPSTSSSLDELATASCDQGHLVRAPLASPEASISDSLDALDNSTDSDVSELLNESCYDNVTQAQSLGCGLDSVSSLPHTSPVCINLVNPKL